MSPTTEVMLMMRPLRSFIIRFTHSLVSRKLADRLVSITWSQSSFFIRSSNVSRVMAALLTSMVGMSPAASSRATSASMEPSVLTFSASPRPPDADSSAVIFAAPSSVDAVPITFAPAAARRNAMARPMPRDAPVTSAVCPCRLDVIAWSSDNCCSKGGIHRRRVLQCQALQFWTLVDAAIQAGQHLAGTALDELRCACRDQFAHQRGPAHRTGQLPREQGADVIDGG